MVEKDKILHPVGSSPLHSYIPRTRGKASINNPASSEATSRSLTDCPKSVLTVPKSHSRSVLQISERVNGENCTEIALICAQIAIILKSATGF